MIFLFPFVLSHFILITLQYINFINFIFGHPIKSCNYICIRFTSFNIEMTKNNEIRFRLLYEQLVQPLYRYVYFKCGDKELSQDVVQDVFSKVWDKMESIDDETASAYCYRAAKNMLINKIEKQASKRNYESNIHLQHNTNSPYQELAAKEFQDYVSKVISSLPELQQEVFLMSRIDKLKYNEIAERLGVSQKAVEKRMSLALKYLRLEIEKYKSR